MHVEILVEEESVEVALSNLLPKIAPNLSYQLYVHQGKHDLLQKLPQRLRGYREWLPADWRILILLDEDREDCIALKARIEDIARSVGFSTRTVRDSSGQFQVITRIVIEELESWFFGDIAALCAAYNGISPTLPNKQRYRDPDAIVGGTWEALLRELQRAGHYRGMNYLPKKEVAALISANMNPASNASRSFCLFRDALQEIYMVS